MSTSICSINPPVPFQHQDVSMDFCQSVQGRGLAEISRKYGPMAALSAFLIYLSSTNTERYLATAICLYSAHPRQRSNLCVSLSSLSDSCAPAQALLSPVDSKPLIHQTMHSLAFPVSALDSEEWALNLGGLSTRIRPWSNLLPLEGLHLFSILESHRDNMVCPL